MRRIHSHHARSSIAWGRGGFGGNLAGVKLVDSAEHGAARPQHPAPVAGLKQLLAVDAAHERHGEAFVAPSVRFV